METERPPSCLNEAYRELSAEEQARRVKSLSDRIKAAESAEQTVDRLTRELATLRGEANLNLALIAKERDDARAEVEALRDTIDTLEMHALRDVAPGWVSVPEVEWDSALAAGRS